MSAAELNAEFGIAGALSFAETETGLVKASVTAAGGTGELYLQGAQVTQWNPARERPVLFMSPHSAFAPGRAIRGGIPVIFPWFGPNRSDPAKPQHGFARSMPWQVIGAARPDPARISVTLALGDDAATAPLWPQQFRAIYEVTFGPRLELRLTVRNLSSHEFVFEEALHSYFAVSKVDKVAVEGLQGCTYIDKTDAMTRKHQAAALLALTGWTDSVYLNTPSQCAIIDPEWRRRIVIDKVGANSTIVWNPWAENAAGMADLGAEVWPSMICVESGNADVDDIHLPPGAEHEMATVISVAPLG